MSTDREARILAAGQSVEVNGKEYKLSPLNAGTLCELEREALRHYKREYLQTITDNLDILCNGDRETFLQNKVAEVARWSVGDLPQKAVFDAKRINVGEWKKNESGELVFEPLPAVAKWVKANYGNAVLSEAAIRSLISTALDALTIKAEDVNAMTGTSPVQGRVRYDQWWITGCFEGMIYLIFESLRINHPEITSAEVKHWSFAKITELARTAEALTVADLGNM